MERRDRTEAAMARSWHDRYADPFSVSQAPTQEAKPRQSFARAGHQPHVDFNHAIDIAHAAGDPVALLDVQLRMMGMESLPPVHTGVVFDAKAHRA